MLVILDLRSVKPISLVLSESMVILPSGCVIRSMAATSELLPAPVRPTMPIWSTIMIVISPHSNCNMCSAYLLHTTNVEFSSYSLLTLSLSLISAVRLLSTVVACPLYLRETLLSEIVPVFGHP